MTTDEHRNLKRLLVEGGSTERYELINSMPLRRLAEFARGLVLAPSDHLVAYTWQQIALALSAEVRETETPTA